jgi:hypothetical protein
VSVRHRQTYIGGIEPGPWEEGWQVRKAQGDQSDQLAEPFFLGGTVRLNS